MSERYSVNGQLVDIPEEEKNNFLRDYPNAERVNEFDVEGEKYFIPLSEQENFLTDFPNASSATNPNATFNRDMFTKDMREIAKLTEDSLKSYYGRDDIQVKTLDKVRTPEEQAEALASGASRTEISVHNYGAGADFQIFMGGKLVDATGGPDATDILKSTEPYQILGNHAREKDYFWGWEWDSGHVGETRFVYELLQEYPELADNDSTRAFYEKYKTEAPLIYKDALSTLDQIYETPQERTYTGQVQPIEDLLPTIKTNKMGFNSTDAQAENILENEIDNVVNNRQDEDDSDTPITTILAPPSKAVRTFPFLAVPEDAELMQPKPPADIGVIFADNENLTTIMKDMDPNTQRFFLALFNEALLGYPAGNNPRVQGLLETQTTEDVFTNTFGQFIGMMLPLGGAMKLVGGAYRGVTSISHVKNMAQKLPKISKMFKPTKRFTTAKAEARTKFMLTTEKVFSSAWQQGTVSAISFALHGQAMHHGDERTLKKAIEEIKHSALAGYGFGSASALGAVNAGLQTLSFPAMYTAGMLMVPDDPDDPLNGSRKHASGLALMTFHLLGVGETVKARETLRSAVKDGMPNASTKQIDKVVDNVYDSVLEVVQVSKKKYTKESPIIIGKDGKPVDPVSKPILDPTGKEQTVFTPIKTAYEIAMEGLGLEKTKKYEALILNPKEPVRISGEKGVVKTNKPTIEQLDIARGLESQINKKYAELKEGIKNDKFSRTEIEFREIEIQELSKTAQSYRNNFTIEETLKLEIKTKEKEIEKAEAKPEIKEEVKKEVKEEITTEPVETKPVETKPTETKPTETKPTETKPAKTKPLKAVTEATIKPNFTERAQQRKANVKAGENVKHTRIKNKTANQDLATNIYKVTIRGNEIIFGKKKGTSEWVQIDKNGREIDLIIKESNSLTEVKGVLERTTTKVGEGGTLAKAEPKKGENAYETLSNFEVKSLHVDVFGPNRKSRVERINDLVEYGNTMSFEFYSNAKNLRVVESSLMNSNPAYIKGSSPKKASFGKNYKYEVTLPRNDIYNLTKDPRGVKQKYTDIKEIKEFLLEEGYKAFIETKQNQSRVQVLSDNVVTTNMVKRTPKGTFEPVLEGQFYENVSVGSLRDINLARIKNVKEYHNSATFSKWESVIQNLANELNIPIDMTPTVGIYKYQSGPLKGTFVMEPSMNIKIGTLDNAKADYFKNKVGEYTIKKILKNKENIDKFGIGPQESIYRFVPSRLLKGGRIDKRFKDNALEYEFQIMGESSNANKLLQYVFDNKIMGASYDPVRNKVFISDFTRTKKSAKLDKLEAYAIENKLIDSRSTIKRSGNLSFPEPQKQNITQFEKNPKNFTSEQKANIDRIFGDWTKYVLSLDKPIAKEIIKLPASQVKEASVERIKFNTAVQNQTVTIRNMIQQGAPLKEIDRAKRALETFKKQFQKYNNIVKDTGTKVYVDAIPGFSLFMQSYSRWKNTRLPKDQAQRHKELIVARDELYKEWHKTGKEDKIMEQRLDELSTDIRALESKVPEPSANELSNAVDDVIKNPDLGTERRKLYIIEQQILNENPRVTPEMLQQIKYDITGKNFKREMNSTELMYLESFYREMLEKPKKETILSKIKQKGEDFSTGFFLTQARNRVKEAPSKEIMDMINMGQAKEGAYQGRYLEKFDRIGVNKKMTLEDAIRMSDILEGKVEPRNALEADMASRIKTLLDSMYKEAGEVGIEVSGKIENYFPRMLSDKYKEILYQDVTSLMKIIGELKAGDKIETLIRQRIDKGKTKQATIDLLQHLQTTGQAKNLADAYRILKRYAHNEVFTPFENLVKERRLELPEYFYERDSRKVLTSYVMGWGRTMAHSEVLGPKGEIVTELHSRIINQQEKTLVLDVLGSWTGEINRDPTKVLSPNLKKFAEAMTQFNVATKIGLGTATIPNMFQIMVSVMPLTGLGTTIKGGFKLLNSKQRQHVRESGAIVTTSLRSLAGYETTGAMGRITEKILDVSFNPINKFNSYMSASIGEVWIKDLHASANRPKQTRTREYARKTLAEYGFDYKQPLTDKGLAEFMFRFATDQQLLRNVTREGVSMNNPKWKYFYLFKKFAVKQPQLIKDNMKQAYNNGGSVELMKYITRLGVSGVLSGEMVIEMRNMIKSTLTGEDYYRTDSNIVERLLNDLAFAGSLGMFSDFIASGVSGYQTDEQLSELMSTLMFTGSPANVQEVIDVGFMLTGFLNELSERGLENALYRARPNVAGRFGSLPRYYGMRYLTPQQRERKSSREKTQALKRVRTALDRFYKSTLEGNSNPDFMKTAVDVFTQYNTMRPQNPINLDELSYDYWLKRYTKEFLDKRVNR